MKPFRPPTIVRPQVSSAPVSVEGPTLKKRKLTPASTGPEKLLDVLHTQRIRSEKPLIERKPLVQIQNATNTAPAQIEDAANEALCYSVLWRKVTAKKNKTWDGDATLAVSGSRAVLKDDSGRVLGQGACNLTLEVGSFFSMAGREIEVQSEVPRESLKSKKQVSKTLTADEQARVMSKTYATLDAEAIKNRIAMRQQMNRVSNSGIKLSAFKTPLLVDSVQAPDKNSRIPTPRHDPKATGALVMKRPRKAPPGKQIVDVVVDPVLSAKLHDHQRAGVSFMYECIMGMNSSGGEGAILADEMGLGKTLQTIALLWTLLKQNPIYEQGPVVKKALIVCPVSLVNNWRKEFRKWLGRESVGVFVADDKHTRLSDFTKGKAYSVMIIGYEKLRTVQEDLQKGTGIDIVIADEGHRLKTAQNKSAAAIKSLNTERRIILSGTPLQNDLAEFYTMVDFVNPGLLNKYSAFKRDFEAPILRSQQPGASETDIEKGEARSLELAEITSQFILRRTADILLDYLPPKTEYVVFCRPTKTQAAVYQAIIKSPIYSAALGSPSISLELINVLKKVCNSPNLLTKKPEGKGDGGEATVMQDILGSLPPDILKFPGASGKLQVLDSLLHVLRTTTDEKVILVSNYTSTMDILANLLTSLSYQYLRLDGTTPAKKRQDLVDTFNRTPPSHSFCFLLSAKAGGVGLNLIGASRLILFDLDWNPATDLQAMARIHRHGQKRPCVIYRFITQGTLDEKIFQRQVSKTGLSDSIVDGKSGASGFTREELRDIFSFDESPACQTHNLLSCSCGGTGQLQSEAASVSDDSEQAEVDKATPPPPLGFIKSSQHDWQAAEEAERVRSRECRDSSGRNKILSLMKYAHFDPRHMSPALDCNAGNAEESGNDLLETAIEDKVLRDVIKNDGDRVGFVFIKPSG